MNSRKKRSAVDLIRAQRQPPHKFARVSALLIALGLLSVFPCPRTAHADGGNCVRVDVYIREQSPQSQAAMSYLRDLEKRRPGIRVQTYDVAKDAQALSRLKEIARRYGQPSASVPTIHTMGRITVGFRDPATSGPQIEELLNVHAYIRSGCSRCAVAYPFLGSLPLWYPGLRVVMHDTAVDPNVTAEMQRLANWFGIAGASVPAFYICGQFKVGYTGDQTTGAEILGLIQPWLTPCQPPPAPENPKPGPTPGPQPGAVAPAAPSASTRPATRNGRGFLFLVSRSRRSEIPPDQANTPDDPSTPRPGSKGTTPPEDPPNEADLPPEAELPGEALSPILGPLGGGALPPLPDSNPKVNEVRVPLFGKLSVSALGLPAFTFLLGLIDGFNPCAMWVLIFLLTVLVGSRDRRKMVAIAGTFVLVSGLAYFAFMAAWLNVFLLLGYARWVQITLGVLAVLMGIVHIKDFFAFQKGFSLSIPESAKPGIYARVRQIITARNLTAAIAGAIVLAVLVNMVELLCTAGLPAVYSQILSGQDFPWWKNYAYLGLYNLAYMLDDTLLLTAVVLTMSRRRLQEKEGRWLKLFSGSVILALGLLMLFWPDALL